MGSPATSDDDSPGCGPGSASRKHDLAPSADTEVDDAVPAQPSLFARLRHEIRVCHYSLRTEEAYVGWARRYVRHHPGRHPRDLGAAEVGAFLTHLAAERNVAAATQAQARAALLFLYGQVLGVQLPWLDEVVTAKQSQRLPVVLTPGEVRRLLQAMDGVAGLVASLLYGTGMRLLEGLRLRVKDVEFERREIVVRDGKGGKDRVTVLPENVIVPLQAQMAHAQRLASDDRRAGVGPVWLPNARAQRKVPGGRAGVRLAMGLPQPCAVERHAHRRTSSAPPVRQTVQRAVAAAVRVNGTRIFPTRGNLDFPTWLRCVFVV